MDYIPVANTALVEIHQRLFGEPLENTLYFENEVAWDNDSLNLMCGAVEEWFRVQMLPWLSRDLTMVQVVATDLTTQTSGTYTLPVSPPEEGGRAQDSEPGSVAIVVSFRTAQRGRSFRGRNYVGGLGVSDVTENRFDQNLLDDLVSAYQQLADTPLVEGTTWVVVSRFHNNAPRVNGITTPITTVVSVDNKVDSQRGRTK